MTENKPITEKDIVWAKQDGLIFKAVDVNKMKLAVQGLMEELKDKQANARCYQSDEFLDFYEGYEEGVLEAIELVKKWVMIDEKE